MHLFSWSVMEPHNYDRWLAQGGADDPPLAAAGRQLFERYDCVAIVTAPASRDLAALHHRVPVTIAPQEFERWLDVRLDNADDIMPLLRGPDEGEFAWHEISTRVNRVVNDDSQLLLPITDEERAAEEPVKKAATRKVTATEDDGQGSLF